MERNEGIATPLSLKAAWQSPVFQVDVLELHGRRGRTRVDTVSTSMPSVVDAVRPRGSEGGAANSGERNDPWIELHGTAEGERGD